MSSPAENLVRNSGALIMAMGRWPSFHDAHVKSVVASERDLIVTVHVFRATVDANGDIVLINHHLVTFGLMDMAQSDLPPDYNGDTLDDLELTPCNEGVRIRFESVIDAERSWSAVCREVRILDLVPCDPQGQAIDDRPRRDRNSALSGNPEKSVGDDELLAAMLTTILGVPQSEHEQWLSENCPDADLRSRMAAALSTRPARPLEEDMTLAVDSEVHAATVAVGTHIGPCVLTRLIGEGGMGAVYEARQEELGRPVAVKLMRTGLATRAARQRFAYEARLLAGLRHPGIAQVFEYGTHGEGGGLDVPYIVMELVEDALPFTGYVADRSLDREASLELFARVCDAVHHAHQHGVVHRDLKPANILVGDGGVAKIIDFGLARDVQDEVVTRSFQTESGAIVGTLPYMSPEQISGRVADVDTRSDVYSLGVVLYEILCGRRPFDFTGLALPEAIAMVRDRPAPGPPADVGRDLARILAKALHKEPDARYASAFALGEDVRRFLQGMPVEARPASLTYSLKLFARRNRALVIAAALIFVAAIVAAVVSTIFAFDAREARDREAERAAAAERLLAETSALSDWVVLDFVPRLREVPGSTRLAEDAVVRLVGHLDAVAPAAAEDPRYLRSIGRGYMQVGIVQGSPSFPNLGRSDDALTSLAKAQEVFERMLEIDRDVEVLADAALARTITGEILVDVGRTDEGMALLREARDELIGLSAGAEDNPRISRILISNHKAFAETWRRQGAWDRAVSELERCLALHDALLARDGDEEARRDSASTLLMLADVELAAGRTARAEERAARALEQLEAVHPEGAARSLDAASDLAVANRVIGDVRQVEGDLDGAVAAFRIVLELRRRVARAFPDDVAAREALVSVLQRVADLEFARSAEPEEPLALYREQVELVRGIVSAAPENIEKRLQLQIALDGFGNALVVAGRLEEAARVSTEELALVEAALGEAPEDPRLLRARAEALALRARYRLGRSFAAGAADPLADIDAALDDFDEAITLYDDLRARGIELPGAESVKQGLEAQRAAAEELLERLEAESP